MNTPAIPQSRNQVFDSLETEMSHLRMQQIRKYFYVYTVTGELTGQQSTLETVSIEQGTDFKCEYMTGRLFSYEDVDGGGDATTFPMPGATDFASSGLSFRFTDARSGRELMSALTPGELIFTPGYGQVFQQPYPFRYYFLENTQLRIEIYNRDNANRVHKYYLAFAGFKYQTANAN